MGVAGMKSRPIYTTLAPDLGGRSHLLVGEGEGRAVLERLLAQMPPGADVHVLHAGPALATDRADVRLFATAAEVLGELGRSLASRGMGTRLYAAGPESFLGLAVQVAL